MHPKGARPMVEIRRIRDDEADLVAGCGMR
jgi:hypothetical protein